MSSPSNIQIIAENYLDEVAIINYNTDPVYPITNLQIPQTSLKWRTEPDAIVPTVVTIAQPEQLTADLVDYRACSGWSMNGHNLGFGSTVRLTLYNTIDRSLNVSSITHTPAAGDIPAFATVTFSQAHGMYDDGRMYGVFLDDIVGSTEFNGKVWDASVLSGNSVSIDIEDMSTYGSGGIAYSMVETYDNSQDGYPIAYGWGEQPWGLGGWYGYDVTAKRQDYITFWFDSVVANYMRVIITDSENVDEYIEAGRMILGDSFTPKYNFLWGAGIDYKSQTRAQRTRSGALISDNRPSFREAKINLDYMSEDEAMQLLDMMDNPGLRSDALISMYPDDPGILGQRTTILGRFVSHGSINRTRYGYNMNITFQEAL